MEYLINNDTSLNESMSIAAELGYSVENIDSELLATLLFKQELREELPEAIEELRDILESVEA